MNKDRNFDDLIDKFRSRIYNGQKGHWRLKLLREDLLPILPVDKPWAIWDAGCGFAQTALWLAQQGHQLTLCDLSSELLKEAQADFARHQLPGEFHHERFQQLAPELADFDLILSHAVLEWLVEPLSGLAILMEKLKPGGYLSLMFYNRNAMVYKNVLRAEWRLKPILQDEYIGKGNKLSPPNPLFPHKVRDFIQQAGFAVIRQTGIRVFHDYIYKDAMANTAEADIFALETKYCREPTYRDMGRYVHLLLKKPQ